MAGSVGHLIMVTGPSGVGKSTVTEQLHQRLGGDWLLWQSDLCSPKRHPIPAQLAANMTREQGLALEGRMFAANIGAISAYLTNDWPVVAELAVMTAAEADDVLRFATVRTMLVQLTCSPATLAKHLQQRDTPVPMDWATNFYEHWGSVNLPGAVRIDVDDTTATQVVDEILRRWTGSDS